NEITPLVNYSISVRKEGKMLVADSFKGKSDDLSLDLSVLCFDIEVYNPLQVPRPSKDPIIMISYSHRRGEKLERGVITYKKIGLPFVEVVKDEAEMLKVFM